MHACRLHAAPTWRATSCPPAVRVTQTCRATFVQRPATDDSQWFNHLDREIAILSSVSFDRNIVQVRLFNRILRVPLGVTHTDIGVSRVNVHVSCQCICFQQISV